MGTRDNDKFYYGNAGTKQQIIGEQLRGHGYILLGNKGTKRKF